MRFPARFATALLTPTVLVAAVLAASATPASAASDRAALTRWTTTSALAQGATHNARVANGKVYMNGGTSSSWTSPWADLGFDAKSLVPSWNVSSPAGSFVRVWVRVRSGSTTGSWDRVATWAIRTDVVDRASGPAQTDDLARLVTDTVTANSGRSFDAWQIKVQINRRSTSGSAPRIDAVNGIAASYTSRSTGTSATTMSKTTTLSVPRSSQMDHTGHFPQWGGGGEAWCSPTSTMMMLRYFDSGPPASTYRWTHDSLRGYVDHAARYTYDHAYDGTGNWSFNTAYATHFGVDAFVTRLYDLREAEAFIKAGIPLVVGVAFGRGELDGAPISSTPGHLLVIRGFTASGSVIANDPAGTGYRQVERTYSRSQFEKAWLRGSGGIAYVIRPSSRSLPADTARW
jgi:hypothetical protein